jgi:hypothetical protein
LTSQSLTGAEYYAFQVGCTRRKKVSHYLKKIGILTSLYVYFAPLPLSINFEARAYCRNVVVYIATQYYPAADMASNADIKLIYVPAAEMLTDNFTIPQPTLTLWKQCTVMGLIRIGLGNGLGNGYDMH